MSDTPDETEEKRELRERTHEVATWVAETFRVSQMIGKHTKRDAVDFSDRFFDEMTTNQFKREVEKSTNAEMEMLMGYFGVGVMAVGLFIESMSAGIEKANQQSGVFVSMRFMLEALQARLQEAAAYAKEVDKGQPLFSDKPQPENPETK